MKNPVNTLIAALELVGLFVINFLIPAETTGQIVGKVAVALVWMALSEIFRRRYLKKLNENDTEKK